jgi:hypothetical protein
MCRRLLVALAFLFGVAVLSDLTWAERRQTKEIEALTATDYVDMGIKLIVVEADPNGQPIVPGNTEKMRIVGDPIIRGGIVKLYRDEDGKPAAQIVAKSRNPVVWFVSQAQADLTVHDGSCPWVLVQGSEGSGKTTVLAMWVAFRVLEHIGTANEIGLTAPTHGRLAHAMKKIRDHWPSRWYHFNKTDKRYTFHAGPIVQMVSAAQRSAEGGSSGQGFDFVAQGGDEWQDHYGNSFEADMIARGRGAPDMRRPDGSIAPKWYPRLLTSTFKDDTGWRDFRAATEKNTRDWHVAKLLGLESPFIGSEHWERFRRGVTLREYQRRVLAMDVGPERQLYYAWRRQVVNDNARPLPGNLRPLPLNAIDVTRRELSRYGRNLGLLLGHDPGKRQHVTEVLKAYEFPSDRRRKDASGAPLPALVRWFVVDEITSPECTVEVHVDHVLRRVREKFGCLQTDWRGGRADDTPGVVVRIDPHTNSGDEHPGRTVYTQWRAAGFTVFAAAYNSQTKKPTPIKVEERVDLLNTLLCNVDNERRLFVLSDEGGTNPVAPELVKAFETMERNEQGDAEWERKDASDRSHWPSAVAFGVFSIEKPRIEAYRNRAAQEAA